jgi:transposase
MSKKKTRGETVVGIDVSKDWVDVAVQRPGGTVEQERFANEVGAWRRLVRWVKKNRRPVRVVLEATGVYHFDLAVFLHAQKDVAVMVVNPRAARHFAAATMQRAKTDAVTALVLVEFAARMEFVPWQPPRAAVLTLRALARRLTALKQQSAAEKNRQQAAGVGEQTPAVVQADIAANVAQLGQRIATLTAEAVTLITGDPELAARYERLQSVPGIAQASGVQLLAELAVLPPELTVRQWVAHAGLDPRPFESGSSVRRPPRISKQGNARLRTALYFPALTAMQHETHVRAFAAQLRTRGLEPMQVVVAVMRKLLHALYGMWKHQADWRGEKFYALGGPATPAVA